MNRHHELLTPVEQLLMHAPVEAELLSSLVVSAGLAYVEQPDTAPVLPRQHCESCSSLKCACTPCLTAFGALRICCGNKPRYPAWSKAMSCVMDFLCLLPKTRTRLLRRG